MVPLSRMKIWQSIESCVFLSVNVFTTRKRDGWKESVFLLIASGFSSFLPSLMLGLYLFYTLDYTVAVAGGIAGCFGTSLTVALYLSRKVRCLWALFVISTFMKKSRNLLLTAGTSIVVLNNFRNTLGNLKGLVKSMTCNLRAKRESLVGPFRTYVEMLKTVGKLLRGITDLGILDINSKLKVSSRLESENFNFTLKEAEQRLNETVTNAQALTETVSSVTRKMFPAISFLLLMLIIALHVKRYCNDVKYKNKFISKKFVLFDEKQKAGGRPHVLPLSSEEEKLYAFLPSARSSPKERRKMLKFGRPILSHLAVWLLFIAVDALMFHFIDIVSKKVANMEPFRVPLIQSFKSIASLLHIPYAEEIHHTDFSFNVTLFERTCLPEPKLHLDRTLYPLSAILITLLVMTLLASKISQLRLMVCERFFTQAADERVRYLHRTILKRRVKTNRDGDECSLMALIKKPHFWCPLLFKCKGNASHGAV